jgi:hypothetical protein
VGKSLVASELERALICLMRVNYFHFIDTLPTAAIIKFVLWVTFVAVSHYGIVEYVNERVTILMNFIIANAGGC